MPRARHLEFVDTDPSGHPWEVVPGDHWATYYRPMLAPTPSRLIDYSSDAAYNDRSGCHRLYCSIYHVLRTLAHVEHRPDALTFEVHKIPRLRPNEKDQLRAALGSLRLKSLSFSCDERFFHDDEESSLLVRDFLSYCLVPLPQASSTLKEIKLETVPRALLIRELWEDVVGPSARYKLPFLTALFSFPLMTSLGRSARQPAVTITPRDPLFRLLTSILLGNFKFTMREMLAFLDMIPPVLNQLCMFEVEMDTDTSRRRGRRGEVSTNNDQDDQEEEDHIPSSWEALLDKIRKAKTFSPCLLPSGPDSRVPFPFQLRNPSGAECDPKAMASEDMRFIWDPLCRPRPRSLARPPPQLNLHSQESDVSINLVEEYVTRISDLSISGGPPVGAREGGGAERATFRRLLTDLGSSGRYAGM